MSYENIYLLTLKTSSNNQPIYDESLRMGAYQVSDTQLIFQEKALKTDEGIKAYKDWLGEDAIVKIEPITDLHQFNNPGLLSFAEANWS